METGSPQSDAPGIGAVFAGDRGVGGDSAILFLEAVVGNGTVAEDGLAIGSAAG